MMVSGRTWIVVLDDSRARFFKREMSGALTEAAPPVTTAVADRSPEARRAQRDKILREALSTTDAACVRNECDRIVAIAPERMLSAFRKQATDTVRARLWRERASEAAMLTPDAIAQAVEVYFRSDAS